MDGALACSLIYTTPINDEVGKFSIIDPTLNGLCWPSVFQGLTLVPSFAVIKDLNSFNRFCLMISWSGNISLL